MVKIAAIQLNSNDAIDDNIASMASLVDAAKQRGAQLILLPENCAFIGERQGQSRDIAEPVEGGGKIMQWFSELAKKHSIWLIVGAFPTIENAKVYQTLLAYNSCGELVTHYHKRHLFDVTLPDESESYRESDAFSAGSEVTVLQTPWGRVGLAICYDLRFPEHFRQLLDTGGIELIVLPAAFTYATGKAHWEVLLRARAIENQCYVLAAGQWGKHRGGRVTWGHSMVINPWGEILDCKEEGDGFALAEWDSELLQKQRRTFPALQHRKN